MDKNPEPQVNELPSKSQRKRDAKVLFDLGRALVELKSAKLRTLPLEPKILEAIEDTRAIKSHVARKRQLQFLAKQLRTIDATPIIEALESSQQQARQDVARFHRAEAWRDALLDGDDHVVTDLVDRHPSANPQALRQLLRNARKETQLGKPPAAARKLFKLLREMDSEQALPPLPEH